MEERGTVAWGAGNPAASKKEAELRANFWARTELCVEVGLWEVLGWTEKETELFLTDGIVPDGYGR